jgi:hypothetical protein
MKNNLFLIFFLLLLLVSCGEDIVTNEFVVDQINTSNNLSEYVIKNNCDGFFDDDYEILNVKDSIGKFNIGDSLILIKKSTYRELLRHVQEKSLSPNIKFK